MVISTRTPEGDPIKCGVCGQEHLVLSSSPPGDSVCPTCGSHAWLAAQKKEKPFPTSEVLQLIPPLVDKIRLSTSRNDLESFLVDGLFECLLPYGVMLWLPNPSFATELTQFSLAASKGEVHSIDFAIEVTEIRKETMRSLNTSMGERLLIYVPLQKKNESSVVGILGIAHRTETTPDERDGFLRFVRSMAAVATGCRAFAQNKIEQ